MISLYCNNLILKRTIFFVISYTLFASIFASCNSINPNASSVRLYEADFRNATNLLNQINSLNEHGKYAESLQYAHQLVNLVEKQKGDKHTGVGAALSVLGGLYTSLGDYDKAIPLLERALSIRENAEGSESPNVATALGLLAQVYMSMGEYHLAKPVARRALEIREKIPGRNLSLLATSQNTLGEIYTAFGEYDKAEPLLLKAIELHHGNDNNHGLLVSLTNLSKLYYAIQSYSAAEPLASEALKIGIEILDPGHPYLAEIHMVLGKIFAARGEYQIALKHFADAQNVYDDVIDRMKGFTSEKQKLLIISKIEKDIPILISLVMDKLSDSPQAIALCLDVILKRKGVVLDVQKQFQSTLFLNDKKSKELFLNLSRIRTQLTSLAFLGLDVAGSEQFKAKAQTLKVEKERLELELISISNAFTVSKKIIQADCKSVAFSLPSKSALVEIVRLPVFQFNASPQKQWLPPRYYAFVLSPQRPMDVKLIDLGDANTIDVAISSFKQALLEGQSFAKIRETALRLGQLAFQPLERAIAPAKVVLLSPDSQLNLVPFEAFIGNDGRFLVDKYTFNYLASGRDVLGFGQGTGVPGKSVVMGDPDYNLSLDELDKFPGTAPLSGRAHAEARRSRDMTGLTFSPLPETRAEVEAIASLLGSQCDLYTGKLATEERLLDYRSPRYLHMATHGFFITDQLVNALAAEDSGGISGFSYLENPLLRSGIALSGANLALSNPERTSGILTAEKVLSLQLRGTELVVLSACETGMGEVRNGEGVFGLRRAFVQAGAKGLVMSMWPVPDQETKELMTSFYNNIIRGNMSRPEALRRAMIQQKDRAIRRYNDPNPLYWAAFIYHGEP